MEKGLLPDAVIEAYDEALKKKGRDGRDEVTNIVNMAIDKIPGRDSRSNTYAISAAAAEWNVTGQHCITKEAARMCGTETALQEAISEQLGTSTALQVSSMPDDGAAKDFFAAADPGPQWLQLI